MHGLILALQLVLYSSMATDQIQTPYWAAGTPEHSVYLGNGLFVSETNPVLSGHPEKIEPYFTWTADAAESAPSMLGHVISIPLLAFFASDWVHTITYNNQILRQAGQPTYHMLAWQMHF